MAKSERSEAFALLTGLINLLRDKGVITEEDIDALLDENATEAAPATRAFRKLRKLKRKKKKKK